MKSILIGMLLAVTVLLSINAVTTQTAIKPAQPKKWVVTYGSPSHLESIINQYSKQGYIVDKIESCHYNSETMLVMYKYY